MLNKIQWIYKGLFYNFYRWQVIVGSPTPEYGAVCVITAWIGFNIITLIDIVNFFIPFKYVGHKIQFFHVIAYGAILLPINYYFLVANKNLIKIKEKFEDQSIQQKKKGMYLTIAYFGLTFFLFLILPIFIRNR